MPHSQKNIDNKDAPSLLSMFFCELKVERSVFVTIKRDKNNRDFIKIKVGILAPINKKSGAGPTGKSGAGVFGKSSGNKATASKGGDSFFGSSTGGKSSSNKPATTPKSSSGLPGLGSSSTGKSSFGASSSKSYPVSPFSTPQGKKSSGGIGIIWLPTRRHNKKKDLVYTGHRDSYPRGKYERSPSMYNFMSGDSPDFKPPKKKEEETDLLMPEKSRAPIAIATAGTAVLPPEIPTDSSEKPEEKQEFIKRDNEETKEAAGDAKERDLKSIKSDDYLENDNMTNKSDKQDSEKYEDKVDSVYLRPPPPHKARSNASSVEDEDCGIKCLYYTLQCCDCVLM